MLPFNDLRVHCSALNESFLLMDMILFFTYVIMLMSFLDKIKKHRFNFADVDTFWRTIESIVAKKGELDFVKIGATQSAFHGATINTINTNQIFQNQTFQGSTENFIANNRSNEKKRPSTPPTVNPLPNLRVCTEEDDPVAKKPKKSISGDWNVLSDGTKIEKPTSLNLTPSDESEDDDLSTSANDDEDDEKDDVPDPEILNFSSSNSRKWSLPSGKFVEDIFITNVSKNSKKYKQKKKSTTIEKAILRYGASRIIDLSAHMRAWFSPTDRQFLAKNHEMLLKIPELPDEVDTFISEVEKMVHQDNSDAALKLCAEKYASSPINSCINKISKIYSEFFYKTIDGEDMLECDSIGHTEIDIIVKAFSYIVDGLNKGLGIRQKWGESFCPLSKSTSYTKGRKCDVRFLSSSGMDLGEWEFAVRATADKTISDRCRSGRINQSILNGLLRLDWNDERVKSIKVPFMQFAGVNGQMLIEDLMNGFYVIFPGQKFQLPTKLAQIDKLKSTVKITKYVMDMYKETSNLVNNLEIGYHTFDDIFKVDEPDTSISAHYKFSICDPWWTPKNQRSKNKKDHGDNNK